MSRISTCIRYFILFSIVLTAAILMLNVSRQESAVMDELAHIPAGYSYTRYLDYRLNPEHPPLVKLIAGLPLLFQKINFPLENSAWQEEVNSQWTIGNQFLYHSDNNADNIIFWARSGLILLTLLFIILIYFFSKELIGRWWALLPTFLFAFSPTILAHGHYVTTDIGAALGFFLSFITFINFLFKPTKNKLFLAGLAFGVAQLMKFSAILLIPYFIFLILIFYLAGIGRTGLTFLRYFCSLIIIFLIGYLLVYLVYFIFTLNYPLEKQISDTQSLLSTFHPSWLPKILAELTENPISKPLAHYLTGLLMVFQRASGGNTAYFMEEVSSSGWWYYFPVVFLLKEPLPSLLIILMALIISLGGFIKSCGRAILRKTIKLTEYLNTHFIEFSMIVFVILYWVSSISSNLNIGIRHILPTLPFIYILSAGMIKRWFSSGSAFSVRNFQVGIFILTRQLFNLSLKTLLFSILLIWYLIICLATFPYYLSYFNLIGGTTTYGYKMAVDSNYDWGQDLRRLTDWIKENLPSEERIAIDYFGGGDLKYYLGDRVSIWWSSKGNPFEEEGIRWFAVSINNLQNAIGKSTPSIQRNPSDEYRWLLNPYQPYTRVGTSIFIYKLE